MSHAGRPPFPADPGPDERPRSRPARHRPSDDRSSRPEFQKLGREVLEGIKRIFKTRNPVIIYPASGTGAWEAALVNTLSPGDKVLMVETGHFAFALAQDGEEAFARRGFHPGRLAHGADHAAIEAKLKEDKAHAIKAVCVVHNETSTGATTRIPLVRAGDRQREASLRS
jgi:alanine-glyoxylate transaminase/serine-glyoxylate transaminase/serine-pyruvate transaminase